MNANYKATCTVHMLDGRVGIISRVFNDFLSMAFWAYGKVEQCSHRADVPDWNVSMSSPFTATVHVGPM